MSLGAFRLNTLSAAVAEIVQGWNVMSMTYDSINTSMATGSEAMTIKADGTKIYFGGGAHNNTITQYSLGSAWNVSSITSDSTSYTFTSPSAIYPLGLFFKPDGTVLYVNNSANVYQYSLSTPWLLSSITYASKTYALQGTGNASIQFSPDGTKMYASSMNADIVYQYELSTAWDISTASYATKNKNVSAQTGNPISVAFKTDGTRMFVSGSNDGVFIYTLSTAWDITTASYLSLKDKNAAVGEIYVSYFKPDGTKHYVLNNFPQKVAQFTVPSL